MVVNFTPDCIELFLNFSKPEYVSKFKIKDKIEITFNDNSSFCDINGNFMKTGFKLGSGFSNELQTQYKRKKKSNTFSVGDFLKDSLIAAMTGNAAVQLLMAGSM